MLKQEVREALKKLGFSDYNVIIYETLLREKELDARMLSQKTKVPYSRVYEILNEMIDKNYIVKIEGRPSTYVPRSPIDVLQGIQKEQEESFARNSAIVKEPLMNLFNEKRSAHSAQVTISYGLTMILTHVRTLLKNAVRSANLMFQDYEALVPEIEDDLKLLKLKHVKTRIIFPAGIRDNERLNAMIEQIGEVRFIERPPTNLIVCDEKNTLFIGAGDYLKNVSEDIIGISMGHAAMAFIANQVFDSFWDSLK